MKTRSIFCSLFFSLAAALPGALIPVHSAFADTEALDFPNLGVNGRDYYQGQTYSLGWRFTTKRKVSVTALGFYDDLKNGFKAGQSHAVGIYDAQTCKLVATTTVRNTDPLTGFFRYRTITPVTLSAGHAYYAQGVTHADNYAIGVPTTVVDPSLQYDGFAAYGPGAETPTDILHCADKFNVNTYFGDYGPSFKLIGTGGTKPSGIAVVCNRGPAEKDPFQCTATVQAVDFSLPAPSGTVTFTADKGGFPYGNVCNLVPTGAPNTTSFCAVTLAQGNDSIPAGTVVPITGAYSGNDIYAASTSVRPNSTVAKLPKTPKVCFSEVPHACDGLNAIFQDLTVSNSTIKPAFEPTFASYYGQTPGIQTAPLRADAQSAIKAPKSKSDITFRVQYILRASDNKQLAALKAANSLKSKLKAGLVIASLDATLKFGANKALRVPLTKQAATLIRAGALANIQSISLKVVVQSIRKGDKKPASSTIVTRAELS